MPDTRDSEKVSPAGTVNALILTVVHSTASLTSLMEEMVPTQALGAAETVESKANRASNDHIFVDWKADLKVGCWELWRAMLGRIYTVQLVCRWLLLRGAWRTTGGVSAAGPPDTIAGHTGHCETY